MGIIYSILNLMPFEWIQFNFMKNAIVAIILITPLFGIIGTMVVNNKMAFFSDALGHSALTGVAIGVLLGINNYIVSMLGFAILFSLLISFILNKSVSSSDTIIAVFSSIGISLGVVLLSLNGNFAKYSNFLIGDILSIQSNEIIMLFIIFIIVIFIWIFAFNPLLLSSINSDLAKSKNIDITFYKNLFMLLVAIIVTISIKWVGMLIINSLLILPAAASRNIAKSVKSYHSWSILFSMISGISGLILSYYIGTSAGATIVLVSSIIFFVTFGIGQALNTNNN